MNRPAKICHWPLLMIPPSWLVFKILSCFVEVEHAIGIPGRLLQVGIGSRCIEQYSSFFGSLPHGSGDVLSHLLGILVEQGVMLYEYQGMVRLF